jgi:hypothetical protein
LATIRKFCEKFFTAERGLLPSAMVDSLSNRCSQAVLLLRTCIAKVAEVHGQQHVKRAVEVSAAGAHNLLMIGPIFDAKGSADLALRKEKQAMDETFFWDLWFLL